MTETRLDLEAVKKRWAEATEGPWFWGTHSRFGVKLMGVKAPRYFVMGFARFGMQGAAPMFQDYDLGIMKRFDEFPLLGTVEYDDRFDGIDNPDALAIAAAPEDVRALIAEVEDLQKAVGAMCWEQCYTDVPMAGSGKCPDDCPLSKFGGVPPPLGVEE